MSEPQPNFAPVLPEWSAYAGEAFNLSERRPLAIVEETDERFVVEGFYHRAEFWRAVIPRRGVAEIIGQRFNFSKPRRREDGTTTHALFFANHVQARIRMQPDRPVKLYPPEGPFVAAHEIDDFCYSVEAVGPWGRKWNTWDALVGNLAIVHRFLSTHDAAFERIMRERMTVLQSPPLPLEGEMLDRVLAAAIRESHAAGLSRPYFMFRLPFAANNCTSEPLRLLDDVLRMPRRRRILRRLPIHPRGYLKLRGLWASGRELPTLNEQLAEWLASEEAKERREIHVRKKKLLPRETALPRVGLARHLGSFLRALRS
jgi:hypothetical protein